jgi:hypothetical protein
VGKVASINAPPDVSLPSTSRPLANPGREIRPGATQEPATKPVQSCHLYAPLFFSMENPMHLSLLASSVNRSAAARPVISFVSFIRASHQKGKIGSLRNFLCLNCLWESSYRYYSVMTPSNGLYGARPWETHYSSLRARRFSVARRLANRGYGNARVVVCSPRSKAAAHSKPRTTDLARAEGLFGNCHDDIFPKASASNELIAHE